MLCSSPRSKRTPTPSIVDIYKQQAGPAMHLSKWTPGEHPPAEAAAALDAARVFLRTSQSAGLSTAEELRGELGDAATKAAATQDAARAALKEMDEADLRVHMQQPLPSPSPAACLNPHPIPNQEHHAAASPNQLRAQP